MLNVKELEKRTEGMMEHEQLFILAMATNRNIVAEVEKLKSEWVDFVDIVYDSDLFTEILNDLGMTTFMDYFNHIHTHEHQLIEQIKTLR